MLNALPGASSAWVHRSEPDTTVRGDGISSCHGWYLSYWPNCTLEERVKLLLDELGKIAAALRQVFGDVPLLLPAAESIKSLSRLKQLEDSLDALVCCWVGALYASNQAVPLGDETCAIWCPEV